MSTFSLIYGEKDAEVRGILAGVQCPSPRRVEELLAQSRTAPLGLAEIGELLQIGATSGATEQFDMLRSFLLGKWRRPQGNQVRYIAPIYVSSFCIDRCAYCNFSASRKATPRKRLTLDELVQQIESVLASGARVIELVYASDPEFGTDRLVNYTATAVSALHNEKGSGVFLCTEHLSSKVYETLKDAGLSGIVQWDETLSRHEYEHWHASSPHKSDFRTRMDNHDRALAAGLDVATGALFGLADFRYDVLMQVAKARHLASEYGQGPFAFGTARIKPIANHGLPRNTCVQDHAYETALMVYRIGEPETGRWLQTRETFEMNLRNMLDGDVFTYRCGDVRPGGYRSKSSQAATEQGQFVVNDLERNAVESQLAACCFRVNYAWMS